MKRWWSGIFIFAGVLLLAQSAGAVSPCYTTKTQSGKENSYVLPWPAGATMELAAACNFDTSNAKVAMFFDATALPAAGAPPDYLVPLAAAASATNPTCASVGLPGGGVTLATGMVAACSTTAATLTVDTTSGGNCKFMVCK